MTPEHFAYLLGTLMVSIIGFFIVRSINKNDKVIDEHENRLDNHDELIQRLIGQIDAMQKISNIQYLEVSKKLDYISNKIDAYDENIKRFYETYDLTKK